MSETAASDTGPQQQEGELPNTHERNAILAAPIVSLRQGIAERWKRVTELIDDLELSDKKSIRKKILAAEATSGYIRKEIERLLDNDLPERAKAGELLALLAATETDVIELQSLRNGFLAEQTGLVSSFFNANRYGAYYEDVLDFSTRKALATEGALRAAETFDPERGEFSTYAYHWMKSMVRKGAEQELKHPKRSLDEHVGQSEDGASFLALIKDESAEQAEAIHARRELISILHATLENMPIQWRRSVELLYGLGGKGNLSPREAADIMQAEGLRTIEKGKAVTGPKVAEWAKQAKRQIAIEMAGYMGEKRAARQD